MLEESTSPQFNYQSATQEEIYKQCKEDLLFAVQWMPEIDNQKGGRASNVAARHLLSEILICLKDYNGAVEQATAVINNPSMSLMTERFGKLKDFTFEGYDYQGEKDPWEMSTGIYSGRIISTVSMEIRNVSGMYSLMLNCKGVAIQVFLAVISDWNVGLVPRGGRKKIWTAHPIG